MNGLILKKEPANFILDGKKTVEIRGFKTHIRDTIAIIMSGTKSIWGTVEIYDCIELNKELYEKDWCKKHKSSKTYEELLKIYPKPYAWLLKNAKRFDEPIAYKHKQGCVTWVKLDDALKI